MIFDDVVNIWGNSLIKQSILSYFVQTDTEALRSWRFEARHPVSDDWVVLRVHLNDSSLATKGATHTWSIEPAQNPNHLYFSKFRIFMTAPNSNGVFIIVFDRSTSSVLQYYFLIFR